MRRSNIEEKKRIPYSSADKPWAYLLTKHKKLWAYTYMSLYAGGLMLGWERSVRSEKVLRFLVVAVDYPAYVYAAKVYKNGGAYAGFKYR